MPAEMIVRRLNERILAIVRVGSTIYPEDIDFFLRKAVEELENHGYNKSTQASVLSHSLLDLYYATKKYDTTLASYVYRKACRFRAGRHWLSFTRRAHSEKPLPALVETIRGIMDRVYDRLQELHGSSVRRSVIIAARWLMACWRFFVRILRGATLSGQSRSRISAAVNRIEHLYDTLFWCVMSIIGDSMLRLSFLFVFFVIGFAFVYCLSWDSFKWQDDGQGSRLAQSLYFSTVILTTLGLGDVHPYLNEGFALVLVAIEAVLGFVMFALLINIIASWKRNP